MGQQGNFFPKPQPLSEHEAALIAEQAMGRALQALHAEPRGPRRPALAGRMRPVRGLTTPQPIAGTLLQQHPEQVMIGLTLVACLIGLATHPFG